MSQPAPLGRRARPPLGVLAALVLAAPAAVLTASAASARPADRPAVIGQRVIGHTVQGRALRAWHLGDADARRTVVAMATMHGDEAAPSRILWSLRDGRPVQGVDLWVLPVYNPDGKVAHDRQNAHGVDLNRNFPVRWIAQGGETSSGPAPRSEPETRAVMRFLRHVDPEAVVSFHQPLDGVDTQGPKRRRFARTLADELNLPRKIFSCGGGCHGTMTQWFNKRFDGVAVTVEYGAHPSRKRLTERAPRQLLRAIGGHR